MLNFGGETRLVIPRIIPHLHVAPATNARIVRPKGNLCRLIIPIPVETELRIVGVVELVNKEI